MKLSEKEIKERLKELDGWEYNDDGLYVYFEFDTFKDVLSFMVRVGFEVEKLQHHPEWKNVYNSLEIFLTTHDEGGVTEKDFELAKIIENMD